MISPTTTYISPNAAFDQSRNPEDDDTASVASTVFGGTGSVPQTPVTPPQRTARRSLLNEMGATSPSYNALVVVGLSTLLGNLGIHEENTPMPDRNESGYKRPPSERTPEKEAEFDKQHVDLYHRPNPTGEQ